MKKETKKEIFSWIWTLAVAFVIALFLNHYIIVNANVPTGSMENTLMTHAWTIGSRTIYKDEMPKRGDIVIFYSDEEQETMVKRVIGLPGETLEIRDAKVYINHSDTPLAEPYLKENWVAMNDGLTYEIPEECYFVMGDNRNNSADGRYWAMEAVDYGAADSIEEAVENEYCFVRQDQILGKAIFRYFPKPTLLNQSPYEEDTDQ